MIQRRRGEGNEDGTNGGSCGIVGNDGKELNTIIYPMHVLMGQKQSVLNRNGPLMMTLHLNVHTNITCAMYTDYIITMYTLSTIPY
jgi:hypothetical protein